jgi:hypothetical protein
MFPAIRMPALLTSTSSAPKRSCTVRHHGGPVGLAGHVVAQEQRALAQHRPPAARPPASLRSVITTRAPSRASRSDGFLAHAAGPAGDQRHLALQSLVHEFPPWIADGSRRPARRPGEHAVGQRQAAHVARRRHAHRRAPGGVQARDGLAGGVEHLAVALVDAQPAQRDGRQRQQRRADRDVERVERACLQRLAHVGRLAQRVVATRRARRRCTHRRWHAAWPGRPSMACGQCLDGLAPSSRPAASAPAPARPGRPTGRRTGIRGWPASAARASSTSQARPPCSSTIAWPSVAP